MGPHQAGATFQCGGKTMSHLKNAALVVAGAACAIVSLAFAEDVKPDSMMMFTPNGKTASMPMPDKAKLDMMMKHAAEMKDDMVILVWGNKTYMIKNEKMPDGKMMFDAWGLHFNE
jgi:hypothetical protein